MDKENHFDLNFNLNINKSSEDVPFISISNSKSHSSKTQNSKNSSSNQKISLTQNNNSSKNSEKKLQKNLLKLSKKIKKISKNNSLEESKSSQIYLYTDNSGRSPYIGIYPKSQVNENSINYSIPEQNKTEKKAEIETPKRNINKKPMYFEQLKYRNKAILSIKDCQGKKLLEYFRDVQGINEDKKKNRVSSVENISNNSMKLKTNILNTNKSWNKNNQSNLISKNNKKIINGGKKLIKKRKLGKLSDIKKLCNLSGIASNNIARRSSSQVKNHSNFDFMNFHKTNSNKIKNINITNNFLSKFSKNKINTRIDYNININKLTTEIKIKSINGPNSDVCSRKFSFSSLKFIENARKNLFHVNNKPVINDLGRSIKISSVKKINKLPFSPPKEMKNSLINIIDKTKNNFFKYSQLKQPRIESKNCTNSINDNFSRKHSCYDRYKNLHMKNKK